MKILFPSVDHHPHQYFCAQQAYDESSSPLRDTIDNFTNLMSLCEKRDVSFAELDKSFDAVYDRRVVAVVPRTSCVATTQPDVKLSYDDILDETKTFLRRGGIAELLNIRILSSTIVEYTVRRTEGGQQGAKACAVQTTTIGSAWVRRGKFVSCKRNRIVTARSGQYEENGKLKDGQWFVGTCLENIERDGGTIRSLLLSNEKFDSSLFATMVNVAQIKSFTGFVSSMRFETRIQPCSGSRITCFYDGDSNEAIAVGYRPKRKKNNEFLVHFRLPLDICDKKQMTDSGVDFFPRYRISTTTHEQVAIEKWNGSKYELLFTTNAGASENGHHQPDIPFQYDVAVHLLDHHHLEGGVNGADLKASGKVAARHDPTLLVCLFFFADMTSKNGHVRTQRLCLNTR